MVVAAKFQGSNGLRQRLMLSILTGRSVVIDNINPDEEGLRPYEHNLLQLIDKITSGSKIQLFNNNTKLNFSPGILIGGELTHNCDLGRSISYYLELILCLAPFTKKPFQLTLNGVTNDQLDPTVDDLKASSIPLMKRFVGDIEGTKLDIKIIARGFQPLGGGQILFTCPLVRQLIPLQLDQPGKLKRVRGLAIAARVSPQMANRMIEESKGILLDHIQDVYIYSDHTKGKTSGQSPGFSLTLTAETREGCFYTASAVSNAKGSGLGPSVPEDTAREATQNLFSVMNRGGCVDTISQGLALILMSFNQKDISKLRMGELSPYSINLLLHIKEFCGLRFTFEQIVSKKNSKELIASCIGIGYRNISRQTY